MLGDEVMKVKVLQDKCICCGSCFSNCPEVYDFDDDGIVHVIVDEVPEDLEEEVLETIKNCPVDAIVREDN